ncbi:hypothetical protein VNO77_04122 [Canavalia gladiata]|uniref:Uncharacterized protein n=1 Tax=Canavalia gladiata TaxID=3824 RepID=A0AAN9MVY0_CANGL
MQGPRFLLEPILKLLPLPPIPDRVAREIRFMVGRWRVEVIPHQALMPYAQGVTKDDMELGDGCGDVSFGSGLRAEIDCNNSINDLHASLLNLVCMRYHRPAVKHTRGRLAIPDSHTDLFSESSQSSPPFFSTSQATEYIHLLNPNMGLRPINRKEEREPLCSVLLLPICVSPD